MRLGTVRIQVNPEGAASATFDGSSVAVESSGLKRSCREVRAWKCEESLLVKIQPSRSKESRSLE